MWSIPAPSIAGGLQRFVRFARTAVSCNGPAVLLPTTGAWAQVREHAALADSWGTGDLLLAHLGPRLVPTLTALAPIASHARWVWPWRPIYHRSPASMAQTAATVDDITGGRFRLGLGVGHRVTMANWHGQEIGSPLAEMREYVAVVRALLAGATPPTAGAGARRSPSGLRTDARTCRSTSPGCPPAMLTLAGEIADGSVLWACPASYVRDVVVPTVAKARTVGKTLGRFHDRGSSSYQPGDRERRCSGRDP